MSRGSMEVLYEFLEFCAGWWPGGGTTGKRIVMEDLGCDFPIDVSQSETRFSPHDWQLVPPSCFIVSIWLQINVGIQLRAGVPLSATAWF